MGDRITYTELDIHKEGIVVAIAEDGTRGEVREYGRMANTSAALQIRGAKEELRQGIYPANRTEYRCRAAPRRIGQANETAPV